MIGFVIHNYYAHQHSITQLWTITLFKIHNNIAHTSNTAAAAMGSAGTRVKAAIPPVIVGIMIIYQFLF